MKNPRRSAAGFSLIELMIASIIIAAAGALLAGGLVTSNRGADLRMQQVLSTQLLASRLALVDDQLQGAQGEDHGTFPPPLEAFHWTQQWEQTPSQLAPLARTVVTVSDGTSTAHVVTYRPVKEPQ